MRYLPNTNNTVIIQTNRTKKFVLVINGRVITRDHFVTFVYIVLPNRPRVVFDNVAACITIET